MKDKFLEYAKRLENSERLVEVYEDLIKIFEENGMYQPQACCYEKLWNITQDHELLQKMGDVFHNKVRNKNAALASYNKYLQFTNPDFYYKYVNTLIELGHSDLDSSIDNNDYSRDIVRLCDNLDTVFYMILYLIKEKDLDGILQMTEVLKEFKSKILFDYKFRQDNDMAMLDSMYNSQKFLSESLSEIKNHNDINRAAIYFDTKNKKAYMNILEDLITYKNYDEAINFYNKDFCRAFECNEKTSIVDICWELSDFNRERGLFGDAVFFQKIAIECELAEDNANA